MPTLQPEFGSPNQSVTISLNSLGNGASRQSSAWDWSEWLDILITFQFKSGPTTVGATGQANIFAFATTDDGTTYTGSAGMNDAAITLFSPTELIFLGRSYLNAINQTKVEGPFSIAAAFGGTLPAKGGVVVQNATGDVLASSMNQAKWQGVRTKVI